METNEITILTDEIILAKNRFIGTVLKEHNLKPNEVKIEQQPHNNKVNIYHNGVILGRWFTEGNFKTVNYDVVIKVHSWCLKNEKRRVLND